MALFKFQKYACQRKIGSICTLYRSIESPFYLLILLADAFFRILCYFYCICAMSHSFGCKQSSQRQRYSIDMSPAECTRLFALFQSVYWQITLSRHHHYHCNIEADAFSIGRRAFIFKRAIARWACTFLSAVCLANPTHVRRCTARRYNVAFVLGIQVHE